MVPAAGDRLSHKETKGLQKDINYQSICCFLQGGRGVALLEPYKMTSSDMLMCMSLIRLGWNEGLTSLVGLNVHSPPLKTLTGIIQRAPEPSGPMSNSLHRWEQVHTEHMWQTEESGNTVVHAVSSSVIGLAVDQWESQTHGKCQAESSQDHAA